MSRAAITNTYPPTGAKASDEYLADGYDRVVGMSSIKKMDADRIKLCLRVANYLASPFGSEEYTYLSYGKEGRDHTLDKNGSPVVKDSQRAKVAVPMRYIGDGPKADFTPGRPQDAKTQHDYQSMEIPQGVADASIGLFSNAVATKNATAVSAAMTTATTAAMTVRDILPPFGIIRAFPRGCQSNGHSLRYRELRRDRTDRVGLLGVEVVVVHGLKGADGVGDAPANRLVEPGLVVGDEQDVLAPGPDRVRRGRRSNLR